MTKQEFDNAAIMDAVNDVVAALEQAAQAIARLNELKEQLEQAGGN